MTDEELQVIQMQATWVPSFAPTTVLRLCKEIADLKIRMRGRGHTLDTLVEFLQKIPRDDLEKYIREHTDLRICQVMLWRVVTGESLEDAVKVFPRK